MDIKEIQKDNWQRAKTELITRKRQKYSITTPQGVLINVDHIQSARPFGKGAIFIKLTDSREDVFFDSDEKRDAFMSRIRSFFCEIP